MDYPLHDGTSSGTDTQYDIIQIVLVDIGVFRSHFSTGPMELNPRAWLSAVTEMVACVEFASGAIYTRASDNKLAHMDFPKRHSATESVADR